MIRYLVTHQTAAILLFLLISLPGLLALPNLTRATFPDIALSDVSITVTYRGASAEEVEASICTRLERALEGTVQLAELRCDSRDSVAAATAGMAEGGDYGRFLNDIRTEVEAIADFPDSADDPVIREAGRTEFVAALAVSGPMRAIDLETYADDLKQRLTRLPEVSQVDVTGFSGREFRIEIPRDRLIAHGLSTEAIARTIGAQSVDLPGGTIQTPGEDIRLRLTDERRSVEDLAAMPVIGSARSGAQLRLGDIATISETHADDHVHYALNGERSAVLRIAKTRAEDTLAVIDAVSRFVAGERRRAPPTVTLAIVEDASSIVRDRLTMLLKNGLQGLALVLFSLWLFFGLRQSLAIALALPVAFLGAFALMAAIGYSLNMITTVALLMAIGLIMDYAIVLSENISAHRQRGTDTLPALVNGTREVAPGLAASFLTVAAVFGPLAFIEGDIGQILGVLPVVLTATLGISLIAAFGIVPRFMAGSIERARGSPPGRVRVGFERLFEVARDRSLTPAVRFAIRFRHLTVGAILFGFLSTVGLVAGGLVQFQAFPDLDGDVVEARILMPQGTPLARTEAIAQTVADALGRVDAEVGPAQPGGRLVRTVQTRLGVNADTGERGAHVATVTADLLAADRRTISISQLTERWRAEIGPVADAVALSLTEPGLGPAGKPIEIRLLGEDIDTLDQAAEATLDWLGGYRGARNLLGDLRPGQTERHIRLTDGARALGLDAATVGNQIRAAFLGVNVREIQIGRDAYEIKVTLPTRDRSSMETFESMMIVAPDGRQVPLTAIASIESGRGWAQIPRIDGRRAVTIEGELDTSAANAVTIANDFEARFVPDLVERFPGITVEVRGQPREGQRTGQSIAQRFLVGLVGVFLILAFQFRSHTEALLTMAAIPLAIAGAVWGHFYLGVPLSMPSLVGAASLAGIVVNNAILLMQVIKRYEADGLTAMDAAVSASRDRFRALFLTSATTILGLAPLLAETSTQAAVLKPLVVSVIFGLIGSTVLILGVIPTLYVILAQWRDGRSPGPDAARAGASPTAAADRLHTPQNSS